MRFKFNLSWAWVTVAIVVNILIFFFMSHHLESYVADTVAKSETIDF